MNQSVAREIIDLMMIYDWLLEKDEAKEAEHVLTLISTLILSLEYTGVLNNPQ